MTDPKPQLGDMRTVDQGRKRRTGQSMVAPLAARSGGKSWRRSMASEPKLKTFARRRHRAIGKGGIVSELDETIARVELIIADSAHESDADMVLCSDLRTLLRAAHRVQAMEAVGGSNVIGRALNAIDCRVGRQGKSYAELEADDLQALVDMVADRQATVDTYIAAVERVTSERDHERVACTVYHDANESLQHKLSQAEARVREAAKLVDTMEELWREDCQLEETIGALRHHLGPIPEAAK